MLTATLSHKPQTIRLKVKISNLTQWAKSSQAEVNGIRTDGLRASAIGLGFRFRV